MPLFNLEEQRLKKESELIDANIAAYKERLKAIIQARIDSMEIQQKNTEAPEMYISYISLIDNQKSFLTLIDKTN